MFSNLLKKVSLLSVLLGVLLCIAPTQGTAAQDPCFCYHKRASTGACDVPSVDCVCCY